MSALSLRIKVGDLEFEASGDDDIVLAQFAVFRKLLPSGTEVAADTQPRPDDHLGPIMHKSGRIVSLKAPAQSLDDALLLLMLGQKVLRNNNGVTGGELMAGLRTSGHQVIRADYLMKRHVANANINVSGKRRSRRYTLTARGLETATALAQKLDPSKAAAPAPNNRG